MSTETSTCPYARYKALREQSAVVEIKPGTFAITRQETAKAVLLDWRTWSAELGGDMFETYGPSSVKEQIAAIMADYDEKPVLMRTDPPAHTRVRNLVSTTLTPAIVRTLEPQITRIIEALAAPWIGRGRVEFIGEFASRVPGAVTTSFLGAPPEMEKTFKFWAAEVMSRFDGPQSPERQLEVAANIAAMGRYFLQQIAVRRQQPSSDLVSLLAHAEIDGDRLEDVAIVNVIETFLIGGHETTTFLLGNCLWQLANDAELHSQLVKSPQLIPLFIEEMLRFEAPTQAAMRTPTRDVEIDGITIPKGSTVLVLLASANRDEAVYDRVDTVRLDRPAMSGIRHMAFGYGNHACIGLHLARAEVRIALETLLPKMAAIAPGSDDPIARLDNFLLRGPTRLDLRFEPAG